MCRVYCILLVFAGLIIFFRAKQVRDDAPLILRRFWRGNGAKPRIGDSPKHSYEGKAARGPWHEHFGRFLWDDRSITLDWSVDLIWQHFQKQYVVVAWDRLIDPIHFNSRRFMVTIVEIDQSISLDRSIPFRETSMHLWWATAEIDQSISLDRSIDHFSS